MEKPFKILLNDLEKLNNNYKEIGNNLSKLFNDLRKDLRIDTKYWIKYANKGGFKELHMIYIRVIEAINKTIESLQEEVDEVNIRENKKRLQ